MLKDNISPLYLKQNRYKRKYPYGYKAIQTSSLLLPIMSSWAYFCYPSYWSLTADTIFLIILPFNKV